MGDRQPVYCLGQMNADWGDVSLRALSPNPTLHCQSTRRPPPAPRLRDCRRSPRLWGPVAHVPVTVWGVRAGAREGLQWVQAGVGNRLKHCQQPLPARPPRPMLTRDPRCRCRRCCCCCRRRRRRRLRCCCCRCCCRHCRVDLNQDSPKASTPRSRRAGMSGAAAASRYAPIAHRPALSPLFPLPHRACSHIDPCPAGEKGQILPSAAE